MAIFAPPMNHMHFTSASLFSSTSCLYTTTRACRTFWLISVLMRPCFVSLKCFIPSQNTSERCRACFPNIILRSFHGGGAAIRPNTTQTTKRGNTAYWLPRICIHAFIHGIAVIFQWTSLWWKQKRKIHTYSERILKVVAMSDLEISWRLWRYLSTSWLASL